MQVTQNDLFLCSTLKEGERRELVAAASCIYGLKQGEVVQVAGTPESLILSP